MRTDDVTEDDEDDKDDCLKGDEGAMEGDEERTAGALTPAVLVCPGPSVTVPDRLLVFSPPF